VVVHFPQDLVVWFVGLDVVTVVVVDELVPHGMEEVGRGLLVVVVIALVQLSQDGVL